jgi:hypothetical protein
VVLVVQDECALVHLRVGEDVVIRAPLLRDGRLERCDGVVKRFDLFSETRFAVGGLGAVPGETVREEGELEADA